MKINNIILQTILMAGIAEEFNSPNPNKARKFTPSKPQNPIIPKGCKEYHFTMSGDFDTTKTKWNDINYMFSCVAINEKKAIEKFNKFKNKL